jgi:hypothetical protein
VQRSETKPTFTRDEVDAERDHEERMSSEHSFVNVSTTTPANVSGVSFDRDDCDWDRG